MAATEENPSRRIASAGELKDRLTQLLHCDISKTDRPDREVTRLGRFFHANRIVFVLVALALMGIGALLMHFLMHTPADKAPAGSRQMLLNGQESIVRLPYPEDLDKILHSEDGSIFHLIPPAELKLASDTPLGSKDIIITPFYFSENPITNYEYIQFLNSNAQRIEISDGGVYLDGRLILKISEEIGGYNPIIYDNEGFSIQQPVHSSCAVLMVTGAGAEAYAGYYGFRLPRPEEWYYVMKTGGDPPEKPLELPAPVLNYPRDYYGLRGINQVAEWGKSRQGDFFAMGRFPATANGEADIVRESPTRYYADTSFRVVRDTPAD